MSHGDFAQVDATHHRIEKQTSQAKMPAEIVDAAIAAVVHIHRYTDSFEVYAPSDARKNSMQTSLRAARNSDCARRSKAKRTVRIRDERRAARLENKATSDAVQFGR